MSVIIEEEIINNYRDGTDIDLSGKTILENSMRGQKKPKKWHVLKGRIQGCIFRCNCGQENGQEDDGSKTLHLEIVDGDEVMGSDQIILSDGDIWLSDSDEIAQE